MPAKTPPYRTDALEAEFRHFARELNKHQHVISRGVGILEAKILESGDTRIELSGGDITIVTTLAGHGEAAIVYALFDLLDQFINQNMVTVPVKL